MKFSIHLSTRIRDKRLEGPLLELMTDMALRADANGFGGISLTEHHMPENQGYQNSMLFAASLAPRLKQATIILATVNPAIHHPVRLVESCNLIDQLAQGRLVVGFGSGFLERDLITFGQDVEHRMDVFEHGIRTALEIWDYDGSRGPLEFQVGTHHGKIETPVNPSPYRKPHPVIARATLTDEGAMEAAANGWAVFTALKDVEGTRSLMRAYHAGLERSGKDAGQIAAARQWSSVARAVHVAETDDLAVSQALAFFERNPSGAIARNPEGMICGSPQTVRDTMQAFADAGVGNTIGNFLIDVEDRSLTDRSFNLFCDEVLAKVAA